MQKVIHNSDDLALSFGNNNPPKLDFANEEAVIVALGEKPTNGFSVEITAITYITDRGENLPGLLSVTYVVKSAKQTSDVITRPLHVVKLKKLEGDVEFNVQNG